VSPTPLGKERGDEETARAEAEAEGTTMLGCSGPLTGRPLLTVRKATLLSVTHILIQTRLLAVSCRFPHLDEDSIHGIEGIWWFTWTMEVSSIPRYCAQAFAEGRLSTRSGPYPERTRARARRLILGQIATENTNQLIKALGRRSVLECKIFVTALMGYLQLLQ